LFGKYPAHVKLIGLLLIFVPLLILKGIIAAFSETKTPTISKNEPTAVQSVSVSPKKTESSVGSLSANEIKPKDESNSTENSKKNMSTQRPERYSYQELESRFNLLMSRVQSGPADVKEILNLADCFLYEYQRTNYGAYMLRCAELYKLATEHGSAKAQYYLARCYLNGAGVPKDYEEAMRRIWIGAHEGDYNSQAWLGGLYFPGNDESELKFLLPEPDIIEAYAWVNLALAGGGSHSIYSAGGMLQIIARQLTTEQTLAAQKRSREILSEIEARKKAKSQQG
jgi:TPR repeat protein